MTKTTNFHTADTIIGDIEDCCSSKDKMRFGFIRLASGIWSIQAICEHAWVKLHANSDDFSLGLTKLYSQVAEKHKTLDE